MVTCINDGGFFVVDQILLRRILSVAFKYENFVCLALLSLGLLEKVILGGMWVAITLDFVEVCKTSKRGVFWGRLNSGC